MKIHRFQCKVCGLRFGLDNTGYGLSEDLSTLVNPRNAEIHLCMECLEKITSLGVKLNLLKHGD